MHTYNTSPFSPQEKLRRNGRNRQTPKWTVRNYKGIRLTLIERELKMRCLYYLNFESLKKRVTPYEQAKITDPQ